MHTETLREKGRATVTNLSRARKLLVVLGVTAVVVASTFVGLNAWLLDGLSGTFFSWVLATDTVFAPDYSDNGFRSVRPGMERREVYELIGPPLERHPAWAEDDEVLESWTRSPSDTHRFLRQVWFDTSGRVIRRHSEFYVD